MNHSESAREQVSALADGQLRGAALAQAVAQVCDDEALRSTWQTYHLIGDAIRAGAHAPATDSNAFMARLQQRLADEPAVVKPVLVPVTASVSRPAVERVEAANEPMFRWKLVAGAASLAAAAAIGWNFVGYGAGASGGAQLAQQDPATNPVLAVASTAPSAPVVAVLEPSRVVVANKPQVMLRDPRLDQLLEAHQQAGGASQMPSGFLRNATFEGSSR